MRGEQLLRTVRSVLVVDWPTRDVPETLARAGFTVVAAGGPAPDSFSAYELRDGEVLVRRVGRPPEHADLVYSHRPVDDLPGIVAMARRVGARAVWVQSGLDSSRARDPKGCWLPEDESRRARNIVESAGMAYVESPYIADAARELTTGS